MDNVIAKHTDIAVLAPLIFLVPAENKGQSIHLQDRCLIWHITRKVLMQQLDVADERQQFIEPRLKHLNLWNDGTIANALGLTGVHKWKFETGIPSLLLNLQIGMGY